MDDETLAAAAAAGEVSALGGLFTRYADVVFQAAYRITASIPDAEDVLQDVFVGLPRALQRYRPQGSFAAWIAKVATRTALMRLRRSPRREQSLRADPEPAEEIDPIRHIAVREALMTMPPGVRMVFLLREVSGYSHDEIAAMLDISIAASRVRLHRAWRRLHAYMRDDP